MRGDACKKTIFTSEHSIKWTGEEKPFIRCLIFAWSFDRTDILSRFYNNTLRLFTQVLSVQYIYREREAQIWLAQARSTLADWLITSPSIPISRWDRREFEGRAHSQGFGKVNIWGYQIIIRVKYAKHSWNNGCLFAFWLEIPTASP